MQVKIKVDEAEIYVKPKDRTWEYLGSYKVFEGPLIRFEMLARIYAAYDKAFEARRRVFKELYRLNRTGDWRDYWRIMKQFKDPTGSEDFHYRMADYNNRCKQGPDISDHYALVNSAPEMLQSVGVRFLQRTAAKAQNATGAVPALEDASDITAQTRRLRPMQPTFAYFMD